MLQPDKLKKLNENALKMSEAGKSKEDILAMKDAFIKQFGTEEPVKKKEDTTSTPPSQKLDSEQKSGSSATPKSINKTLPIDEFGVTNFNVPKASVKKETAPIAEQKPLVQTDTLGTTTFDGKDTFAPEVDLNAQNFDKAKNIRSEYNRATTIPEEKDAEFEQEYSAKVNNEGILNNVKSGLKSWWNNVAGISPDLKMSTDHLIDEKKQANSELKQELNGKEPTPQQIEQRTKEIFLEKKKDDYRQSLSNDYISSLSEEDRKLVEVKLAKELPSLDKDYVNKSNSFILIGKDIDALEKSIEEDRRVIKAQEEMGNTNMNPKIYDDLNNKIDLFNNKITVARSIEKDLAESKYKLGTVTDELDNFKREYGTVDVLANRLKSGIGNIGYGLKSFRNYVDRADIYFGTDIKGVNRDVAEIEQSEKDVDFAKKVIEKEEGYFRKRLNEVNGVGDFMDYTLDVVGDQTINALPFILTGGLGGGAVIFGSSAGNKYAEMIDGELNETPFSRIYTDEQKVVAPFVFASADTFLSTIPTFGRMMKGKRVIQAALKEPNGLSLFRQSSLDSSKKALQKVLKDNASEQLEEQGANLIQNITNVLYLKEDGATMLDGVEDVFKDTATFSTLLSVFPTAIGGVIKAVSSKSETAKMDDNAKQIIALKQKINQSNIPDTQKAIIQSQIDKKVDENSSIISGIQKKMKAKGDVFVGKVNEVNKEIDKTLSQAKEIQSSNLDRNEKKVVLDGLLQDYTALNEKREFLLSNESTAVDVLPLKEQEKLKKEAMAQLVNELNPDGDKDVEITNEQVVERANKLYKEEVKQKQEDRKKPLEENVQNETPITEVEQTPQPQAEKQAEVSKVKIPEWYKEEHNSRLKGYDEDIAYAKKSLEEEKARGFFTRDKKEIKYYEDKLKFYEDKAKLLRENPIEFYKSELKGVKRSHEKRLLDDTTYEQDMIDNFGTTDFEVTHSDFIENTNRKISDYELEQKTADKNANKPQAEVKETEQENITDVPRTNAANMEETPVIADEVKPVGKITDVEYSDFIDKGIVSEERLSNIANKVKNQEKLSGKETAIFNDKTSEINEILKNESTPTENTPTDGNVQLGVDKMGEVAIDEKPTAEVVEEENLQPANEVGEVKINQEPSLDDIADFVKQQFLNKPAAEKKEPKKQVEKQPVKKEEESKQAKGFISIALDKLTTSLKDFQGRGVEYSKQTYDRIVNEAKEGVLNISTIPPVQIWKDPKTGDFVILAGHSRTKAFSDLANGEIQYDDKYKKSDFTNINAQIVEAETLEEAQKIAQESNQGAVQTVVDNAKYVRENLLPTFNNFNQAKTKLKSLYGSAWARIYAYANLNPRGKAMQMLKQFQEANESDSNDKSKKIAEWTGKARQEFPNLTDAHENEIFDYLSKNDKIKTYAELGELLNRRVNGLEEFNINEPLNFEQKVGRGSNEVEVVKQIQDLKNRDAEIKKKIRELQSFGKNINDSQRKQIKDLTAESIKINTVDIPNAQIKQKQARVADAEQFDIFSQINEQIENGNITPEQVDEFVNDDRKAEEIEPIVEVIESKAKSDKKIELEEVVAEVEAVLGKPKLTESERKVRNHKGRIYQNPKDGYYYEVTGYNSGYYTIKDAETGKVSKEKEVDFDNNFIDVTDEVEKQNAGITSESSAVQNGSNFDITQFEDNVFEVKDGYDKNALTYKVVVGNAFDLDSSTITKEGKPLRKNENLPKGLLLAIQNHVERFNPQSKVREINRFLGRELNTPIPVFDGDVKKAKQQRKDLANAEVDTDLVSKEYYDKFQKDFPNTLLAIEEKNGLITLFENGETREIEPSNFYKELKSALDKGYKGIGKVTRKFVDAETKKLLANAEVDKIAQKVKDFLPGIKDGDNLNAQGFTQDQLIDLIASAVKNLIAAGIEINEAINQVVTALKQKFDFDVDVDTIKSKVEPKKKTTSKKAKKETIDENLNEFKKEQGKKSLLSRLAEGSSKVVKEAIKNISLNYEISKIEDARNLAKEIFQKLGVEEATIAVSDKNSGIQGDVRAFLYQEVSNDITSRIMALRNEIDAKSIEEFGFLQEALARIKMEMDMSSRDAGRFINALQHIYNGSEGEYSLSKVIKRWEAANDQKIPDDLMEKFAETNKRIVELEKQLFELSQKKDKEDAQAELDNIIDSEKETKKSKPAKKKYAVSKEKREERAKLKKEILKDYFGTLNDVTRFMTMLADPKVIKYLKMTLVENGGDFVDFSKTLIDELGTEVRKYTKELFLKAGGQEADIVDFVNGPITIDADNNIHIPRSVLFDLINQGYTEIDALAEQVIEMLKEDYPDNDFTIREIRDAITKYGKITKPNENELLKQLGKMTRLGRLISQLEDAKSGQRPKKSGFQRLIPKTEQEKLDKDKERRIKREIDDILRDLNIPLTDAETEFFIKSQQDKIKTRLENEIRDLDDQIAKEEKRKNIKNPIEYSQENKDLKDKRDAKKERLDALVGKPELTDEQKIERLETFLERNIEKLEKQILTQTFDFKEKPTPLDSANLTRLREKRDALRSEIAKIREEKGLIEERRLKNAKKSRINKIAELKKRIKEKDFSKKERKPLPTDKELEEIQDELDGLKEVYATELYKTEVEKENKIRRLAKSVFYGIASLPRTALASLEASFMMIQNGYYNMSYIFDDIVSIPKGAINRVKEINKLYKQSASKGFVPFVKVLVNSGDVNRSKFLDVLKITAKALGSAKAEVEMRKQMQKQYYYNLAIKSGLQITRTDGKLDAKQEMYLNDIFVYGLDAPGYVLKVVTKGKKYDPIGRKAINLVRKAIGREAIVGEKYDALEQTKNINIQRVTERGMVSMANHIMMQEFTKGAELLELMGKNRIDDAQDFKELANAINNMSGRSGLYIPFKIKGSNYYSPEGKISGLIFFSYKLAATYVNTMNPFWHLSLGSKENFVFKEVKGQKVPVFYKPTYAQKLALKTMAKFFTVTTMLGMLYAKAIAGEDDDEEKSIYSVGYIETDIRSTNFGRIYQGNGVWIDPYVGKLQVAILMAKFFSGEEKNKYTGNISTIAKATENKKNQLDLVSNWITNKLAPAPRIPYEYTTGEIVEDEITGKEKRLVGFDREEFNLVESLVGNIPMYWTTLSDLAESEQERELYNNALYISLFSGYPGVSVDSKYKTTDYDIAKLKTEERERRNALNDLANDLVDKKITVEKANAKINKMYEGLLVKEMENGIKSVNSEIRKRGSEETALRIVSQNNKKARAILLYDAYGDIFSNPAIYEIDADLKKLGYNLAEDEVTRFYYEKIINKNKPSN